MNALTTTGTPPQTVVGISGTVTINGKPVTINTGSLNDLKKGIIIFNLPAPVTLGTLDELITWFNQHFGTSIPSIEQIGTYLPTSPIDLQSAFDSILGGTMVLTVLNINTSTSPGTYAVAFNYTLAKPLDILGILTLDSVGLSIVSE